jgi:hypothetical protein
VQFAVEDGHVGRCLDVGGGHLPRAPHVDPDGDGVVGLAGDDEVLEVQDHVGDVLGDAADGVELVQGVIETHLGDGRTGDRRQQRAAQGRAERVPEPGFEGTDGELLAVGFLVAEGFDGGPLDDEHAGVPCVGGLVASGGG